MLAPWRCSVMSPWPYHLLLQVPWSNPLRHCVSGLQRVKFTCSTGPLLMVPEGAEGRGRPEAGLGHAQTPDRLCPETRRGCRVGWKRPTGADKEGSFLQATCQMWTGPNTEIGRPRTLWVWFKGSCSEPDPCRAPSGDGDGPRSCPPRPVGNIDPSLGSSGPEWAGLGEPRAGA